MRRLLSILLLLSLYGCTFPQELTESSLDSVQKLEENEPDFLAIFLNDIGLEDDLYELFAAALDGNEAAVTKLRSILDEDTFKLAFVSYRYNVDSYLHLYQIGTYYQNKEEYEKAAVWYLRSANTGNYAPAATYAGNAYREIGQYSDAFDCYEMAYELESNGITNYYLGISYMQGIGVKSDLSMARHFFETGAFLFNVPCILQLIKLLDDGNELKLYKTGLQLSPFQLYTEGGYSTLERLLISAAKQDFVKELSEIYDSSLDPAVISIQASSYSNIWFDNQLTAQLQRASYLNSKIDFASDNAVPANYNRLELDYDYQGREQESNWFFDPYNTNYGTSACYVYDLDGDGIDELSTDYHSGTGGAKNGIPFIVYEQNAESLFMAPQFPEVLYTNDLRFIEIDGIYYFVAYRRNHSSDFDIIRYTGDGEYHTATVHSTNLVTSKVYETDTGELHESTLLLLESQLLEAMEASKNMKIYTPEEEITYFEQEQLTGLYNYQILDCHMISIDIDNDGVLEYLRRSYVEASNIYDYYYYYFDLFDMLDSCSVISRDEIYSGSDEDILGEVGLQHVGTMFEKLPFQQKAEQIWFIEQDGVTYTCALSLKNTIYSLNVYRFYDSEATIVHQGLYYNEPYSIEILFDCDD